MFSILISNPRLNSCAYFLNTCLLTFLFILLCLLNACTDSSSSHSLLNITEMPSDSSSTPSSSLGQSPLSIECSAQQHFPYPPHIPYTGIHANAANNDYVPCITPNGWKQDWHALRGLGMTQPNTFSPDGSVIYVTTTHPQPDGCRLYALNAKTGQYQWCSSYPTDIERGSIEVDEEGHLYFTTQEHLVSLDAQGELRWETPLMDHLDQPSGGWGVHFTPDGYVATVTSSGRVYLIQRQDGQVMSTLDVQTSLNFVPPQPFGFDLDPSALLPESVQNDIASIWGNASNDEQREGFGALLGSGEFVDNTISISSRGEMYVISGGPSDEQGALIQIKVDTSSEIPQMNVGQCNIPSTNPVKMLQSPCL